MTLMAGPVDTSINPTEVNKLANKHPLEWFEKNLITTVPRRYAGADRRVYPGFLQLSAFMSMNLSRHVRAHIDLFGHILRARSTRPRPTANSMTNISRSRTCRRNSIWRRCARCSRNIICRAAFSPIATARWIPRAIRKTALLTVEGERDDICGWARPWRRRTCCASVKPFRKKHYVQPGVGHYGVFSGTRWQTQIYPMVRNTILASE